jgi:hypothetical protein
MQILGGSGRGKSSLLEHMVRQDILAGRGLCLVDPHGTLADSIVAWCASRRLNDLRRIHIIEAADLNWSASFNPLRLDGFSDPSVRVDAMVAACAQVWGGEDTTKTPLLRKCLTAVFYALAVRGLTLVEGAELINSTDPHQVRRNLTDNLPDYIIEGLWRDFNGLKRGEFLEQFGSTNSRLNLFLGSPAVRRILGQTSRCIDLKQVMDRGEILIVNLAAKDKLSHENVRVLGTLLTSELFLLAVARDRVSARRPFTLYIDECSEFVTDDVERMLDQTRKFGLHVVLAHQRLSQLKRRSEFIRDAVLGGTHTKVVFGGLWDDDAEVMAREVFRETMSVERPKHILDKPIVVDEVPYWLESETNTSSASQTYTASEGTTWGASAGASEGYSAQFDPDINDPYAINLSSGISSGETFGTSATTSFGETQGTARSVGRSQTLKPVRQMMPTAVYSLEEQLHLAIVKLRGLPKQAAIVKRPNGLPTRIRPTDVLPPASGEARRQEFIDSVRSESGFIAPSEFVDAEIADRLLQLRAIEPRPAEDDFWAE